MQPVLIHQIAVGPMANFSYLIEDTDRKVAAYVDPGWEAAKIVALAAQKGLHIEKILLTHSHFDHIQELSQATASTRAPVFVHALEAGSVEAAGAARLGAALHSVASEETITIGRLSVKCLHTPGHTPGMICFLISHHLITGDMLFVNGCGRVDLPGSDPDAMFQSLRRLSQMPDETIIYPGHDYGPTPTSTLGQQKKMNPYLSAAMKGKDLFFERRGV